MTDPTDPLPPPTLESRVAALEARANQHRDAINKNVITLFERADLLLEELNNLTEGHNDLADITLKVVKGLAADLRQHGGAIAEIKTILGMPQP